MRLSTPFVSLMLILTACARPPVRSNPQSGLAVQLRILIEDQKSLNRELEHFLDAVIELNRAKKVLKRHPLFSEVRKKFLEWEAQSLVDPGKKDTLAYNMWASFSEEERKLASKMGDLEKQGRDLFLRVEKMWATIEREPKVTEVVPYKLK